MEQLEGVEEPAPVDTEPSDPPAPLNPGSLVHAAVGCLAGMTLGIVLAQITLAFRPDSDDLWVTAAVLVGLWIGLLGAAFWASRTRGTGSMTRDFGVRVTWGDLGLGLLAGLAVQILVALMYSPFSEVDSELSAPARDLAQQAPDRLAQAVLTVLIVGGAPFVEEIFFRGLLLGALRRLGTAVAVIVSAAAFALVHMQPLAIPALTVLGIVLALMTVGRRRLGAAIVTHATFNGITMAVLLFPSS